MAKRQTIPQQAAIMLHAIPAALAKGPRIKPGNDGLIRVHQGFELRSGDMARLRALRTKKERLNFLMDVMRHWLDSFAAELIEHGLIHCHVQPDPTDDQRIRVSLGMNIRV